MRNLLVLLVFIATAVGCDGQKKKNKTQQVTNYYFIRHAEKDLSDPTNRNPDLTSEGEARAERWRDYFSDKEIDAVYSTKFTRTLETARPTAKANNLIIKGYDPKALYDEAFKLATTGLNVVVVGHSNTTPNFANAVYGEPDAFKEIDESEYYHLYHVQLVGEGQGIVKKMQALVID